jgi:serine/threonine protein kinase
MDYLHSLHYLHRDLTSKNVFIRKLAPIPSDDCEEPQLVAVIGDFGFAAIEPTIDHKLPTVGSPYWLAPECIKGQWFVFCCQLFYSNFSFFLSFSRKQKSFLSKVLKVLFIF